ncbi:MAG: hypothetical protein JWO79_3682 [Actinomycetia bacterium]|nr:hypothetical protein [Actinomycetes bacterium]
MDTTALRLFPERFLTVTAGITAPITAGITAGIRRLA